MNSDKEHGIAENGAFYTWVARGMLWPHLICICGHKSFGENWEEVGASFDEHLAPFKEKNK